MSEVEEPPSKMSKYEEYLEDIEGEEFDEGQEEWLSEGILTDDDYNTMDTNKINSNFGDASMEEESMMSIQETDGGAPSGPNKASQIEKADQKMEDTLDNLDGKNDLSELDAFLIRKTDTKVFEAKVKEIKPVKKEKEEDDGNDTDDLLRLLEDGQQSKKKNKNLKIVKTEKPAPQDTSDEDEFVYERSKTKTLKLVKNPVRKIPSKAVPEKMSDSDLTDAESSEDGNTLEKIFEIKKSNTKARNSNITPNKVITSLVKVKVNQTKDKPKQPQKGILKTKKSETESEPFKTQIISRAPLKQLEKVVKVASPTLDKKPENKDMKAKVKIEEKNTKIEVKNIKIEEKNIKIEDKNIKIEEKNTNAKELDEIIDEEEFLEEDDFELDEQEFEEDSGMENSKKQRIMRPEMMDEEVPSDEDSQSEYGSIYDELPSSGSEDLDDWFTLDVRAETAADYLPLLGESARSLLVAEKRRAATRVNTLRTSLSALNESARRQADSLRQAAIALAEIEDTLRAA